MLINWLTCSPDKQCETEKNVTQCYQIGLLPDWPFLPTGINYQTKDQNIWYQRSERFNDLLCTNWLLLDIYLEMVY